MPDFDMVHAYFWDDEERLITFLAKQLVQGRLALILGAGVSKPFGLPEWKNLVLGLYAPFGIGPDPALTPEEQAEVIKADRFNSDDALYKAAVRDALYDGIYNVDYEELRKNKTLSAIGALLMASHRGNISKVITLNFDNFLELYLQYHGFAVISAAEAIHWNRSGDVFVYHPHGLLPFQGTGEPRGELVFDQESFMKVIENPNGLWFQEVLTILRTHICLFIGLSGKDQNLDSLMISSRDRHVSGGENLPYWGLRFTTDSAPGRTTLWKRRKIHTKVVGNYEHELPNFLFRVCQKAAQMRLNG